MKQMDVEPEPNNRVRSDWQQKERREVLMSGVQNGGKMGVGAAL